MQATTKCGASNASNSICCTTHCQAADLGDGFNRGGAPHCKHTEAVKGIITCTCVRTHNSVNHALEITHCHRLFERSLFGAVGIYNHLPQIVIDLEDISKFQSALTNIARWRCSNGVEDWIYSFSAGHPGAYVGTVYG